jgi:hypothetical protein
MEGQIMKKKEKRATKRNKQSLKDLRAKAASPVKGGAGTVSGTLKWGDIELKRGVD